MLGKIGGFIAILGVVVAPITSGDTAFRGARLIVADVFNFKQKAVKMSRTATISPRIGLMMMFRHFSILTSYYQSSGSGVHTKRQLFFIQMLFKSIRFANVILFSLNYLRCFLVGVGNLLKILRHFGKLLD